MAVKRAKKASKKVTPRTKPAEVSKSSNNFLSSIPFLKKDKKTSESSNRAGYKQALAQKRVWGSFLGLIVLVVLVYLGFRNFVIARVNNWPLTTFQMDQLLEDKYKKDAREELI